MEACIVLLLVFIINWTVVVHMQMQKIILGTWQIQSAKEINKVLDAALEAGYRLRFLLEIQYFR